MADRSVGTDEEVIVADERKTDSAERTIALDTRTVGMMRNVASTLTIYRHVTDADDRRPPSRPRARSSDRDNATRSRKRCHERPERATW